jgi:ureidoglycolate hydrolase
MSRRGFVSPARAARMLGVHQKTAYSWARASALGRPSRLKNVERHPLTGYLHIPVDEIRRLKNGNETE